MNIQRTQSLNFNAVILPISQVYNTPVPAIVKTVSAINREAAAHTDTFIKGAPFENLPAKKIFPLHEAIVTDPKIKIAGRSKKDTRCFKNGTSRRRRGRKIK